MRENTSARCPCRPVSRHVHTCTQTDSHKHTQPLFLKILENSELSLIFYSLMNGSVIYDTNNLYILVWTSIGQNLRSVICTSTVAKYPQPLTVKLHRGKKPHVSHLATISQGTAILVLSCFSLAVLHSTPALAKGCNPRPLLTWAKNVPTAKKIWGLFFLTRFRNNMVKKRKTKQNKKQKNTHTHTHVLVFGKLGEASIKLRLTREIVQNFKFSRLSVTLQMIISIFQPGTAWRIAPTLRLRLWFILTHHPAV